MVRSYTTVSIWLMAGRNVTTVYSAGGIAFSFVGDQSLRKCLAACRFLLTSFSRDQLAPAGVVDVMGGVD